MDYKGELIMGNRKKSEIFGERLLNLRKNKKLTQRQLADVIGLSAPAIHSYENGTKEPSITNLNKLADFFEVSVDFLLYRESELKTPTKDDHATDKSMIEILDFLPVVVSRKVLRSESLSYTAKGLFAYFVCEGIETMDEKKMFRPNIESKREIEDALQELIDFGAIGISKAV